MSKQRVEPLVRMRNPKADCDLFILLLIPISVCTVTQEINMIEGYGKKKRNDH